MVKYVESKILTILNITLSLVLLSSMFIGAVYVKPYTMRFKQVEASIVQLEANQKTVNPTAIQIQIDYISSQLEEIKEDVKYIRNFFFTLPR